MRRFFVASHDLVRAVDGVVVARCVRILFPPVPSGCRYGLFPPLPNEIEIGSSLL